jgi:hypothetical protein
MRELMIIKLLNEARTALFQQQVPLPFTAVMTEAMWKQLRVELDKRFPAVLRDRRRFMGQVAGFDVYVDDDAPPGSVSFGGKQP